VINGVPTILNLNPPSAFVPATGFNLSVNGSNYVSNSVVRWNGTDRTTTFVSDSKLIAAITNADVASTGTANVTVFNPAPGGGESNVIVFAINNPSPSVFGMAPWLVSPGGGNFTLTIKGLNFIPVSTVQFGGT